MVNLDPREFRNALGQFATGVTIVTTVDAEGRPAGVTASSFNSVSLNPPLVLWSLAKTAQSMEAFQSSGRFAVHVLASDQQELSDRFARAGTDKFAGVTYHKSESGLPLFDDCAARFVCQTTYQYEGGDHIIFVGEVVEFERQDKAPLVFHEGRYKDARGKVSEEAAGDAVDTRRGTFSEDFFSYLLSRAHFQTSYPVRQERAAAGMQEDEYMCLALLSLVASLTLEDLQQRLEHTGQAPTADTLRRLQDKGWVNAEAQTRGACYSMSDQGRDIFVDLLAKAKAVEESQLAAFSPGEIAEMRSFLRRLIASTDPGIPSFWQR